MRVVFISNHRFDFSLKSTYNNGGWIKGLLQQIEKIPNVEPHILFFAPKGTNKFKKGSASYYPIPFNNRTLYERFKQRYHLENFDRKKETLKLIEDINPDIIHIFGLECFACDFIDELEKNKVIIHLQGILPAVANAFLPPFTSKTNSVVKKLTNVIDKRSENSIKTMKWVRNFSGRTKWDQSILKLINPDSNYFKVNEILREKIYKARPWQQIPRDSIVLTTTISDSMYKGIDLILKTSKLLKVFQNLDFEWRIIGLNKDSKSLKFFEKLFDIYHFEYNIKLLGILDIESIISHLRESNIYIHTSYIENSSNSLSEALYLGVPSIAVDAGGISTFIKSGENGELIPSNDPYCLSSTIIDLLGNQKKQNIFSQKGRNEAITRHDKKQIVNDTLNMYNKIRDKNVF